ncbi:MAG: peptidylprolyl isomerase [Candidatus Aenigmarchaeota archaeon]|nr:peptidylprolyl isomerase [Candidatus Aenigmarchaeota archaeon]
MEEGNFIYIDLIGRVKDTGEIFETTKEDVAKQEGIFNKRFKYKPLLQIIGSKALVPGLENTIKSMQVGEKRIIELEPKDAFGERRDELIKLFNIAMFKERGIDPFPGASVTINGLPGRILSVSGGRVKVDFNHPLAGKPIIYEVEVKEEIKNLEEKIPAIISAYSNLEKDEFSTKIQEKVVEIDTKDKDLASEVKRAISTTIKRWVGDVEKIKFISYF